MAKQENPSLDKANKPADKDHSGKQSGKDENAILPKQGLDTESEFAVNELREEKRDSE